MGSERVSIKKEELRNAFLGALQNCHENRYQFSALLADQLETFESG